MTEAGFPLVSSKKTSDPKMVGLWKIGRTIGTGTSGRVRIARHMKTGQYAAVKIVSKSHLMTRVSLKHLADETEHNRLAVEREIVVMKLIDHPSIMRLYDVWETSTNLYLILEYVQGGELFDYLCKKGKLPVPEALNYFQQIIGAIDYCHRFNIAHRDLKPENILLDREFNIKIADFGMAAWQVSNKDGMLRTSCGSPHYAAPEIISGKAYNGSAADIWSCGIILYALLSGKLPFDDEDCAVLLEKVMEGKYTMPAEIGPVAQNLIRQMLNRNVDARITMPEIIAHPFYRLQAPKCIVQPFPTLTDIARPIQDMSSVDPDIFANLRTLWHGTPDEEILESLTNETPNWQKGIYHLLQIYRSKYHQDYLDEEKEIERMRLRRRRTKTMKEKEKYTINADSVAPNPTDRSLSPKDSLGHRFSPPDCTIKLSCSHLPEMPSSGAVVPSGSANIRSPVAEEVQAFFDQVVHQLEIFPHNLSSVPTTIPNMKDRLATGTRPLSVRRKPPTERSVPTRASSDKENLEVNDASQKSKANKAIKVPRLIRAKTKTKSVKTRKERSDNSSGNILTSVKNGHPTSDSPHAPHGEYPPTPSAFSSPPKRSWLGHVFKVKATTFALVSFNGVQNTRAQCRRLLSEINIQVISEYADDCGIVIRCRLQDVRDQGNLLGITKAVKFRIEMRQAVRVDLPNIDPIISIILVHEGGSCDTFKAIFKSFQSQWTADGGSEIVKQLRCGETVIST